MAFQNSLGRWEANLAETAELAYKGRNEQGEREPLYKAIGPFIFFMSLLMMVGEGFLLIVTIFLRVAIITRYQ
jgi:hypothetical protein